MVCVLTSFSTIFPSLLDGMSACIHQIVLGSTLWSETNHSFMAADHKTSSPKGNDRSPENGQVKSSKYFK